MSVECSLEAVLIAKPTCLTSPPLQHPRQTARNKPPEGVAQLSSQKPKPSELVKEELRGQSPSWQKSRDRRTWSRRQLGGKYARGAGLDARHKKLGALGLGGWATFVNCPIDNWAAVGNTAVWSRGKTCQ